MGAGRSIVIARLASVAGVALGALGLLRWCFGVVAIQHIVPSIWMLHPNNALSLVLAGCALWLITSETGSPWLRRLAPWLLALLPTLTLIEYATAVNLGIDHILPELHPEDAGFSPRRLALISAIEFVLLAIALGLHDRRRPGSDGVFVIAGSAGFLIALLALITYAYELPPLGLPTVSPLIGSLAAGALALMFIGLLTSRADLGWVALLRSSASTGVMARWLLPTAVIAPLIIGWAALQMQTRGVLDARSGIAAAAIINLVVLTGTIWLGATIADGLRAALERREQLYRATVESSLDALVMMDADGLILEWNPQAERMFGWPRGEALGRLMAETLIPPAQREAHQQGLARYLSTGEHKLLGKRIEVAAYHRDGREFPVELVITPLPYASAVVFSGFIRDLTHIKRAEAQLRQAQKMEAVGQLTGGVAHDFNNLLTVIISLLDSALDRVSDEVRPRVKMALDAAERGATMINQLLAFSRRQVLSPEAVDLNTVVTGIEAMLRRTLGERISIDVSLAASHPHALADRAQVESALLNLAINARDAMTNGGALTIETQIAHLDAAYAAQNPEATPGAYALLSVSDTGAGMSEEVLARAVDPFFTTKSAGEGTGLGLSMIHGFAKQSNGHLKIYSEVGRGTAVRLYLPLVEAAGARAKEDVSDVTPPSRGETILLVEDDARVRATALMHLRDLGYTTLEAADADIARTILDGGAHVDLLFTDVVMPGTTGNILASEALLKRPNLKVLHTSGYTENTIVHHGRLDPGVHFIAKPYRLDDLARKLRETIGDAD